MKIDRIFSLAAGRLGGLSYYKYRVRRSLAFSAMEPVLVWQMGKVGSSSVYRTLRDMGRPAFHVHVLSDEMIRRGERRARARRQNTNADMENIAIREAFIQSDRSWPIVTLVREPMSRNVSAFFENLDVYVGKNPISTLRSVSSPVAHLREVFIERFDHSRPGDWFDYELRAFTGMDLLRSEFDRDAGYGVYRSDGSSVAIIRMEDLDRVGESVLSEFLGQETGPLARENVAGQKWYSQYYREFLASPELPSALLDSVYFSRYAETFYSSEERARARERWGRSATAS